MVERLKHAIEKARALREAEAQAQPAARVRGAAAALRAAEPVEADVFARDPFGGPEPAPARAAPKDPVAAFWASLREIALDAETLEGSRIVTREKSGPAHIPFDVLRTRLMRVFRDNGWTRVGVTSPRKGCGKTLVCCNLALSLARQNDLRTALVDLDLKAPMLARTFGVRSAPPIAWMLAGRSPIESAMVRYGHNLAIGFNGERVRDSAELIHDDATGRALATLTERLKPDVLIYDLPPMMVGDDVIAFLPHVDCILMVAAAGQTTPREIEECEAMLAGQTNFLGVVLNKAEYGAATEGYEYYK